MFHGFIYSPALPTVQWRKQDLNEKTTQNIIMLREIPGFLLVASKSKPSKP